MKNTEFVTTNSPEPSEKRSYIDRAKDAILNAEKNLKGEYARSPETTIIRCFISQLSVVSGFIELAEITKQILPENLKPIRKRLDTLTKKATELNISHLSRKNDISEKELLELIVELDILKE